MALKFVHHPDYDAKFPADHRFPMGKKSTLMSVLTERGSSPPARFPPASLFETAARYP